MNEHERKSKMIGDMLDRMDENNRLRDIVRGKIMGMSAVYMADARNTGHPVWKVGEQIMPLDWQPPDPLTDLNAAMEALDAWADTCNGEHTIVSRSPGWKKHCVILSGDGCAARIEDDTLPRAICRALVAMVKEVG